MLFDHRGGAVEEACVLVQAVVIRRLARGRARQAISRPALDPRVPGSRNNYVEAMREDGMARLRGFGLVTVVGLVFAASGCTSAPSTAQVADLHRQAQEALTRWDAAVAASSGGTGFVLVGEFHPLRRE